MLVGGAKTLDRTLDRYRRAGLTEICDQHNIRATTRDNTWQNTKDIHPVPGQKLKFVTPPGIMGGSPGELSEELVTYEKQKNGCGINCDVGEATEGLENELWRRWNDGKVGEWDELIVIVIAELILQSFRHFTYATTHSPTLPRLNLRHSSFFNPSVALPTSQLILQPFRSFTYITAHCPTLPLLYLHHSWFSNPSEASPTSQLILQPFRHFTYVKLILQPFRHFSYVTTHSPTLPSLYLRHSSFSNPYFASPTSQDLHLIRLESRPCWT